MDESLGLVNGPHDDPAKCPTYYDGCNCTVETLKHNLNCLKLVEEERDGLLLQIRELQSLIMEFLDGCGPRDLHDDGCPEDDTCECPLVKKVNRAMRGYKENDTLKQNDFEPLNPPMTDRWGFEHDMRVGPCSCGAVHTKNDALKPDHESDQR